MNLSWGDRAILWIADHLPRAVLEQPERVLVNAVMALIGAVSLVPGVQTVPPAWPWWVRYPWMTVMVAGALISLYGTFQGSRVADRVGALFLALATFFFGTNLFLLYGDARNITASIFVAIAAAKVLRFIRSSAVRARDTDRLMYHVEQQRKGQER